MRYNVTGTRVEDRGALIVSIGLASLGWLLTHYVDRLIQSPTVEYTISAANCDTQDVARRTCDYRYKVTNLSRTATFGPIRFDFEKSGTQIAGLWVEPVEPAHEGDSPPQIVPTTATFQMASLMPGAAVSIFVRAKGPRPTMFVRSGQAIRMSPRTLETRLVRCEMKIMILLIVIWIGVVAYLILRRPTQPADKITIHRHLVACTEPGEVKAP